MKVLSTEGLTKLIDLVKSNFISNADTEEVTEIDTETTSEVTLATVATTGAYSDLSGKPTVDQTYDGTSANAQSGVAVASAISAKANNDLTNAVPTASFAIAMNNAGIRTVVETYSSGASWYRVYSDGWCEQGGSNFGQSVDNRVTITLLKPYKDLNYCVSFGDFQRFQGTGSWPTGCSYKTASSFTHQGSASDASNLNSFDWQACGYIS